MRFAKKIFNVILVLSLDLLSEVNSCGITNVYQEANNDTADEVTLSWQLTSECSATNFRRFQVSALHKKFYACADETNNSVTTYETSESSIKISNLHPFSLYRFTITGIPTVGSKISTQTDVSTPASVPQLRPRRRSYQVNYVYTQAIYFKWSEAEGDACRWRNGRPSGYKSVYFYTGSGVEPGTSFLNSPFYRKTLLLYKCWPHRF